MYYQVLLDILAFGHILSAMGWLGGGLLTLFAVAPNLMKLAPVARLEFNVRVLPRIMAFMRMTIISTFVFGLLFLYELYDGNFSGFMSTARGQGIASGVVLGLLAAIVGFSVTFPSFSKIVRMSDEAMKSTPPAPSADMAKYAARARIGSTIGLVLLLLALAAMVYAGAYGFN